MGRTYRVLIADDVPALRRLVRRALEASGRFEVVAEAGDGAAAVDAVGRHRPDLALLDMAMPVMDGLEALPKMRAASPETVVAVVSGFFAERLAPLVQERGAAGYLSKGIEPAQLVAELLLLLGDAVTDVPRSADVVLPADPTSARTARRFLATHLEAWGAEAALDDAQLLVTELVANAVLHARSEASLSLSYDGELLRIEVGDEGGGALVMRDPDESTPGGRGLHIVDHVAAAWGTTSAGKRKSVWFELRVA